MGVFKEPWKKRGYRLVYEGPLPAYLRLLKWMPWLRYVQWWHLAVLAVAATTVAIYVLKQPLPSALASVDGSVVTEADLQAEARAEGLDPGALDAAATRRVLARVIDRRLLVEAARKAGVTGDPAFQALRARADEMILAGAVAQRLVGPPPEIGDAQARRYIADNPALFAQRQIYTVDAIPAELSQIPPAMLEKVNTMDDAVAMLGMLQLPVKRATQRIDSASLTPAVAAQLAALPPGKAIVVNTGGTGFIGTVVQHSPGAPPPEQQVAVAREALARQQTGSRVERALVAMRSKARISYAPGQPH